MDQARQIYLALKDSPASIATLRSRRITLALDCVDPDKALETTSFTLNGQSGAGQLRGTKADLLALIGRVLWMVDNTCSLSTRKTGICL